MKENADIGQSKTSFRNSDWILILGAEPHGEREILNALPAGSSSRDSRVPLETALIYLFLFTVIAVFVIK